MTVGQIITLAQQGHSLAQIQTMELESTMDRLLAQYERIAAKAVAGFESMLDSLNKLIDRVQCELDQRIVSL